SDQWGGIDEYRELQTAMQSAIFTVLSITFGVRTASVECARYFCQTSLLSYFW
ncbi:hypothetical protein J6590_036810, partial [Homalodisca vitripennis]